MQVVLYRVLILQGWESPLKINLKTEGEGGRKKKKSFCFFSKYPQVILNTCTFGIQIFYDLYIKTAYLPHAFLSSTSL